MLSLLLRQAYLPTRNVSPALEAAIAEIRHELGLLEAHFDSGSGP